MTDVNSRLGRLEERVNENRKFIWAILFIAGFGTIAAWVSLGLTLLPSFFELFNPSFALR